MRTYKDDGNFDPVDLFMDRWNRRVRSFRIYGIVVAVLMIVLGIVLCVFPGQSVRVIEIIAALIIMLLGIYQFADYSSLPVMFQRGGLLVNAILNVILGFLLLISPPDIGISTFSFLFSVLLMIFGVDLLAFSGKLGYFGITGYGWVIAAGVISILVSVLFMFLPLASAIALNYILAIYLMAGGITVLIEAVSMKDLQIKE